MYNVYCTKERKTVVTFLKDINSTHTASGVAVYFLDYIIADTTWYFLRGKIGVEV